MTDRGFSKQILSIALPIMLQNCVTTFVGLLDNLMVGQLGGAAVSAVAIVNQILSVYSFCISGVVAGAGVLGAQYFGCGDVSGTRHCFRLRLWLCGGITLLAMPLFWLCGGSVIRLFLLGDGDAAQAAETFSLAVTYLRIRVVGLLLTAAVTCYAGMLRETGHAVLPMRAAFAAVLVNGALNYLLIFGPGFFPAWGVAGAAVATVAAQLTECGMIVWQVHSRKQRYLYPFAQGIWQGEKMPAGMFGAIVKESLPLTANQFLWAVGGVLLNQQYSLCSLDSMTAMNIAGTFWSFLSTGFIAFGAAAGILTGQLLGNNDVDGARVLARKLLRLSLLVGIFSGVVFAGVSTLIPQIYHIPVAVRRLTTGVILIQALFMHAVGLTQTAYAVLRAGGKTGLPFLIDILCVWLLAVPLAILLAQSGVGLLPMYFVCQAVEWVKNLIALLCIHKGKWAQCIVRES